MSKRFAFLSVFFVFALLGAPFQLKAFGGSADSQRPGATVHGDVLTALEAVSEADVIIHLVPIPLPPPDQLDPTTLEDYIRQVAEAQDQVLGVLTAGEFTSAHEYSVLPALAGRISASGLEKLEGRADVLTVSSDIPLFLTLAESAPLIRAPEVHAQGINGSGVNVAVADSGVANDHQDLASSIVGEECFVTCPDGTNRQSGVGSAQDDNGHGTHVSGIITSDGLTLGLSNGVAPNAGIFAYRVCSGGICSLGALQGAVDHILNTTLERNSEGLPPLTAFINMSLGDGNRWSAGTCRTDQPTIDSALGNLRLFGVLSFAASGNDAFKDGINWPACSPPVVSVGAVYDADIGSRTWTSANCTDAATAADKAACFSNTSDDLNLLAPGAGIASTWPVSFPPRESCYDSISGGLTCSGTSMASPHAVGVAALLKQALPGLTPDDIESRLKSTGKWIKDDFNDADPATFRWTPRIDARVALLTDDNSDFDLDGCSNGQEFGSLANAGGLRNPLDFWDFYDVWTPDPQNRASTTESVPSQSMTLPRLPVGS